MKARKDLERLGDIPVCTSLRRGRSKFITSLFLKLSSKRKNVTKKCAETFKTMGNIADTLP